MRILSNPASVADTPCMPMHGQLIHCMCMGYHIQYIQNIVGPSVPYNAAIYESSGIKCPVYALKTCSLYVFVGIYYHVLKQTIWLQLSSTEIQTWDPDHNQNVTIDALDRLANDPTGLSLL